MTLALLLTTSGAAVGDHLQGYENNPVDHDELGRSDEPDGLQTPPGMFPFQVRQAVVDRDFDGFADVPTPPPLLGRSHLLAPGCTDLDGSRAFAGQCGIGAMFDEPPPGAVGRGSCPGRYGDGALVFLDARADLALGVGGGHPVLVDLNHKFSDTDAHSGGVLRSLGVRPLLAGTTVLWAWYGLWADLNCNGVIDHIANDNGPAADQHNEFRWFGACIEHVGQEALAVAPGEDSVPGTLGRILYRTTTIQARLCEEDLNPNSAPRGQQGAARTTMVAWVWPGDAQPVTAPTLLPGGGLDEDQPLPMYPADPTHVRPDLIGMDNSGAVTTEDRYWLLGGTTPVAFYDHSIFLDTWVVVGVNCLPSPGTEAAFAVGVSGGPGSPCTFLDVDRYEAWYPLTDWLLPPLKSSVQDVWNHVAKEVNDAVGNTGPTDRLVDQVTGHEFYDHTLGPQRGTLQDLLLDPGWSREPNQGPLTLQGQGRSVEDVHVDLRHGACDRDANVSARDEAHRGWCNVAPSDPAGAKAYAAFRGEQGRGWLDLQARKVAFWLPPTDLGEAGLDPLPGAGQGWPFDAWRPLVPGQDPLGVDEHARTLDPGQWRFQAAMGRWSDRDTVVDESVFPQAPAALPCHDAPGQEVCVTYPRDGWVGFVASGWQEYNGYHATGCVTERGNGTYAWAVCNPYKDGHVDDPQDYDAANGEWLPLCHLAAEAVMWVHPRDGEWSIPVLVATDAEGRPHDWTGGAPYVPYLPGDTRPIALRMGCDEDGLATSLDHLVLPQGSAGEDIVTTFAARVPVVVEGQPVFDDITDVDLYASAVVA